MTSWKVGVASWKGTLNFGSLDFGGAVSGRVVLGGAAVYRCDNRQEPDRL
jgi:hypothetical protein